MAAIESTDEDKEENTNQASSATESPEAFHFRIPTTFEEFRELKKIRMQGQAKNNPVNQAKRESSSTPRVQSPESTPAENPRAVVRRKAVDAVAAAAESTESQAVPARRWNETSEIE
jgi:hypothetical protein